MAVQLTIDSITGQSPYDIYVCQTGGTGCFYMTTINSVPYTFNIPVPYDNLSAYMLKVIDANGCIITAEEPVTTCSFTTPTPTPTNTTTPTITPTNTTTPETSPSPTPTTTTTPTVTPTPGVSPSPTSTQTSTPTPTLTTTPTITPTTTVTSSPGASPSPTSTQTSTPTETPTNTPTETPTNTPTETPTNTPTQTPTNTETPTETPTNTPTQTPTNTETPTQTPTNTPYLGCSAPALNIVNLTSGSLFSLSFFLTTGPGFCTTIIPQYSRSNTGPWTNGGAGGCTSPISVDTGDPTGTWYFRLEQICLGTSVYSNVGSYVYITPTPTITPTITPTVTPTPIVITPLVGCTTGTTQIDACTNYNGSGPFTTFYITTGTVQLGTVFFYDINLTLPVYTADWIVTPAGEAVPVNTFDGQVTTNPPYFNC
jgi:hypothetical protein